MHQNLLLLPLEKGSDLIHGEPVPRTLLLRLPLPHRLLKPGNPYRYAVLAEKPIRPDRATARVAQPAIIFGLELHPVLVGSEHPGRKDSLELGERVHRSMAVIVLTPLEEPLPRQVEQYARAQDVGKRRSHGSSLTKLAYHE